MRWYGSAKGVSLVETVMNMLLTAIVISIVMVMLSITFKIGFQIHSQLTIDEEIVKLSSNLKYIVSRNWTGLDLSEGLDGDTITLESRFPLIPEASVATITYLDGRLMFIYRESENTLARTVLAEHLDQFTFYDLEGQYLYYRAVFEYRGATKQIEGAVRIY
ncbi:MAG TPA: hypothetical protein PKU79_08295 [Mesotoga sp.]|nr:hypothetical protein [Mesotoga sp.]